ncbi:MAG TPA: twin-arginine translocase TatA/TatE family subunit [Polyangiaceae bacterium]|nr:twin-arginine translocase TatA/TatE family subunit [Polyangiaceae bacterium]
MLGVSFSEIVMIAIVALIVVGPRRLPEILGTMGKWVARIRRMTTEVRRQTGIDDILREEGFSGGISELRSMMRGELSNLQRYAQEHPQGAPAAAAANLYVDPYGEHAAYDRLREQPIEGPDAYGAIPEDLIAAAAPVPPVPVAAELPTTTLVESAPSLVPESPAVTTSPALTTSPVVVPSTTESKGPS